MFQNGVTPVNFSWGWPIVVWGWTNLAHQGSMSVVTRNKCYRNLDLPRFSHFIKQDFNPPNIFRMLVFKGSFLNVLKSKKDTSLLNHLARKISIRTIQKDHLFFIIFISKLPSTLQANYYLASSTSQSNSITTNI